MNANATSASARPLLISIGGLPATGKTTIARLVAADQLRLGLDVVSESVNPLDVTRDAWRDVAERHGARLLEVEVVCTDLAEHRRRAETREIDIPGLEPPTWQEIVDRDYRPWSRQPLVVDTAMVEADAAAAAVHAAALDLV